MALEQILGAVILVSIFPLAIAIVIAFANGRDQFWRGLVYGFGCEAVMGGIIGGITLAAWLLRGGNAA